MPTMRREPSCNTGRRDYCSTATGAIWSSCRISQNYRNWTFRIESRNPGVVLSVTEDNIPDETKRARSEEFWSGVLATIKGIVEARTKGVVQGALDSSDA